MASSTLETQKAHRAQLTFMQEHPEATSYALAAINEWGKKECVLQFAIAQLVLEVHAMGLRKEALVDIRQPLPRVVARQRPTPTPSTLVRRTR